MLREAIEKIVELAHPETFTVGDHSYIADKNGDTHEIHPDVEIPDMVRVYSLDALVKLIKAEALVMYGGPVFVTVPKHDMVNVFLRPLLGDGHGVRQYLYEAYAADVPGWDERVVKPFDQAYVALMTRFQEGGDREYAIELLSDITTGAEIQYAENGFATHIITRKGAALKNPPAAIKPVVNLRPYRTFQEVEQPEGLFLIRVEESGVIFQEADGGMWKLMARRTVADWLTEKLAEEVKDGKVVIAL